MFTVDFCGLKLKNPFVIGAGPYSCDTEIILKNLDRIADAGWAGVVLKSIARDEKLTEERYGRSRYRTYGYHHAGTKWFGDDSRDKETEPR